MTSIQHLRVNSDSFAHARLNNDQINATLGYNRDTHRRCRYVCSYVLVSGACLEATRAGEFFMDLAKGLAGYRRGGPAKIVTVSSAFLEVFPVAQLPMWQQPEHLQIP